MESDRNDGKLMNIQQICQDQQQHSKELPSDPVVLDVRADDFNVWQRPLIKDRPNQKIITEEKIENRGINYWKIGKK